jgi:hypothetical protein
MKKIYCSQDGTPHDVGSKYCTECGQLLASLTPKKAEKLDTKLIDIEEDMSENPIKIDIENPENFGFEVSVQQQKTTIGNIVSTAPPKKSDYKPEIINRPKNKISKKKFLEQFKAEAGTSRPA